MIIKTQILNNITSIRDYNEICIKLNELIRNMTYSNEGTSSVMLMYKQTSSIKSVFVGLINDERTDDCNRGSTSDDSMHSMYVGSTYVEMTNNFDEGSTLDNDVDFFWRIQNHTIYGIRVNVFIFKVSVSHIITIHESTKMTAIFVLKCVI